MRLSIVIPTLNEAENLKELLPHLLDNSDSRLEEIIIVDAPNSMDKAAAIAQTYRVTYLKSPNRGRALQMNEGARRSKGTYIYFVHADARPPKSYLSDIEASLNANYKAGYFSYRFTSNCPLLKINAYCTRFDGIFAGGGDQTFFIEKETFWAIGGFEEDYCIMEDFDMIRKLRNTETTYQIIKSHVLISDRKYQSNSYLRVNFANLVVFGMFHLGFHPQKLKKTYSFLLKHRK